MTPKDRALLAQETATAEGLRLRAYPDSKGIWTIGYGTNLQELVIDKATAEKWLAEKLADAERECQQFPFWDRLSGRRQRALAEMAYNMGSTRLRGFVKMLAAFDRGDFETAAREALDSEWKEDVGPTRSQRIADLIRMG